MAQKTTLVERILRLKNPYPNSAILYEYLISIIIAVSLWAYYTVKLGIFSFNLAKKYNFNLSGLSQSMTYFGPYRDLSDYQWKYFRKNFNFICCFAIIFVVLSQLIKKNLNIIFSKFFYLITGVCFTYYLHGNKIIFFYITVIGTYSLCKFYNRLGGFWFTFLTWTFCILIKVLSEIYRGFSLRSIGLDLSESEVMGWNISFGLNMLKIISYNMEFKNEMLNKEKENNLTVAKNHCKDCKEGKYCLTFLKKDVRNQKSDFTFFNMIVYFFYPPLYLSGPIIVFNSFMFQINQYKINNHNKITREKIIYTLRFIFVFFFFELFNHYVYVNCYFTNRSNKFVLESEGNFDYFYLALFSFNNLTFLWLKFTVIWRTARIWAWYDGVFTEENMNRCVYNNYCFEEFWRAWHRSYNTWLIRYIYIPLGGKKNKLLNMWIVFSFVALWHDLKLNLLIWGWFICFFLVPEIIVKQYFSQKKLDYLHGKFWFRFIKYVFCSLYIILMVIANLIGFGMGSEGVTEITFKILKMTSPIYFIKILLFLVPSSVFMFYIRDMERLVLGKENVKF